MYSQTDDQTVLGDADITGQIVLIHGIASSETLPTTVKGIGTDDQHETMPVLCGIITKSEVTDGGGDGPEQQVEGFLRRSPTVQTVRLQWRFPDRWPLPGLHP